jgi:3D (Asp-Asp-Asp) domain-containing protein
VLRGTRRWGPFPVAVLCGALVGGTLFASGAAARSEAATTVAEQVNVSYRLRVDAVAYHLPGRTASGLPVRRGVVAVDPRLIPLGTRLHVPGYGRSIAADVGTAIKGRIIDLWMPSTEEARAWGRRTVTITVFR